MLTVLYLIVEIFLTKASAIGAFCLHMDDMVVLICFDSLFFHFHCNFCVFSFVLLHFSIVALFMQLPSTISIQQLARAKRTKDTDDGCEAEHQNHERKENDWMLAC